MSENNKADKHLPAEEKQEVMVLEDEKALLFDHEYDGIKELNNALPPWWVYLFYVTIIFGFFYFIGYDIFGWFDHQQAEYKAEVAYYQGGKKLELKLLTDEASLASAEKTFKMTCSPCHGMLGNGISAGNPTLGPNMTDRYWINGKGTLEDVVKVITNGANNGMISWKHLGDQKILELASYILVKLQGSNPPNSKKPEGTLIADEPKKETPQKKTDEAAKKKADEEAAKKKAAEEGCRQEKRRK